ncbi:MAG: Uma2 family endonuclease [Oscillospiraceae bacterium]|nr:Uma2 family endonuclease [Oscillospiraceae bacterium]
MDSQRKQNIVPLTIEEFHAIYKNDDERYELVDGIPYMMAAPNMGHQWLITLLFGEIFNFLKGKKCRVFVAPCDVFLSESVRDEDGKLKKNLRTKGTVVQPDIMVVCDDKKIKPDGCHGAPDFIIEITSESTRDKDKSLKLHKYFKSGVREYWIVDSYEETIDVYLFNAGNANTNKRSRSAKVQTFGFEDKVRSNILEGLEIDFASFDFDLNFESR